MSENKQENQITQELRDHQRFGGNRSTLVAFIVLIGLISGILGGILGVVVVEPWYKENILGESTNRQRVEEHIIVTEESAIVDAVEEVNKSVVSIVISKDLPKLEQLGSPFDGFFFSVPSGEIERQQIGAGSGFIVSADGLIVTNRHVVSDEQAEYTVVTKDGQKFDAKIVDTDPFNDVAVVRIEADGLTPVKLGDSEKLNLGQKVIAIGNALGEFQNTVTTGVVSGVGRNITASGGTQTETLSELIQTDAAINPGNSGGPLLNVSGEVIGVNTAVSQQAQLIGFAIPINQVKKVIDDVKEFGKIRRPFLGIRYQIITSGFAELNHISVDYGAFLISGNTNKEPAVVSGSPADSAGLKSGDVILEIDGQKVTQVQPITDILRRYNPGDKVVLKILREEKDFVVSVNLGEAE